MMIERSDEETGELVRAWLQRYGLTIIAGIVLAIAILSGYEWWKQRQLQAKGNMSAVVLALNDAVAAGKLQQSQKLYAQLQDNDTLKPLAALLMATLAHDKKRPAQEISHYLQVATQAQDKLVAQTARWQLAQQQIVSGDYSAAEQSLQALKGSSYENQLALMHAVIAQKQGNNQRALDDYQQALADNPESSVFINAQIAAIEGDIAVGIQQEK